MKQITSTPIPAPIPDPRRYALRVPGSNENVMGPLTRGNVYLTAYPAIVEGEPAIDALQPGERTRARYTLSGEAGVYDIWRIDTAAPATRSYAAAVLADNSGIYVTNGMRFATGAEAEIYAQELEGRWFAVRAWRVEPSTDPVSYRIVDGRAVPTA